MKAILQRRRNTLIDAHHGMFSLCATTGSINQQAF